MVELNRLVDAVPGYRDRVDAAEKKLREVINSDYQAGIVAFTNIAEDILQKPSD
ncbi:hypothetical protein JZM27_12980 [Providencia huaxiensis]|uniref:hypothetical protein n=1 Tax=Providencia huaxiensis TaxID=2027290 RepID=UPI0019D10E59|nr:hypothetical protein [Providencia huaxiensis]MBN6362146.1 hypothetical protein [Providencia huaxiensis]